MKNKLLLLVAAIVVLVACNNTKTQKNCTTTTFAELPDPNADKALPMWEGITKGLNVSFASIDQCYAKSEVPDVTKTTSTTLTGWKGERLSAQIVIWTVDSVKQVECKISDFKAEGKTTLPASIAQARFVRYVMTDIFEPGCGYRKPEDFPASLVADMLDNLSSFDIDAHTTRPVWVTIDIPRNAEAGNYNAQVTITSQNGSTENLALKLVVQNKTLPETKDWKYHLDLWQHPSAIARVHNLKMWSDEHFNAMRPYMEMLAQAGQKVITATLNKDPWNVQCYDRYADMITWTLNADGTWVYDYTVFDRWVQLMMDLGINKQINCYSMVPWNNELHYFDSKKNDTITVKADPGTKVFVDMWTPFLNDFVKHLDSKGWTTITNIAMDERSPEMMKATIELLQQVAPQLGIALADNHKSYKEYPFIKDLCVSFGATVDANDLAYRKANNLVTTYYVCCSHKFPNMFTFSNPAESVYTAWYAVAADFDGFLRWAYNSWVENPLTDSRFRTWPAGDTYVVYPDARSSIRFERLREGIQDAEKIRVLKSELAAQTSADAKEKYNKLQQFLAKLNTTEISAEPCQVVLNEGKHLLNELSN